MSTPKRATRGEQQAARAAREALDVFVVENGREKLVPIRTEGVERREWGAPILDPAGRPCYRVRLVPLGIGGPWRLTCQTYDWNTGLERVIASEAKARAAFDGIQDYTMRRTLWNVRGLRPI